MNDVAIAASSSSQPPPSATRAPSAPPMQPRREEQRPDPARDRDAGEQPQPADLAIARLTQQLESQRALRALALGVQLLALQIEPLGVAIERFFQRGDDDAGQPRLEPAEPARPPASSCCGRIAPALAQRAILRLRAKSVTPITASRIRSHGTASALLTSLRATARGTPSAPAVSEPPAFVGDDLDVRILGQRDASRSSRPRSDRRTRPRSCRPVCAAAAPP